MYNNLLVCSAPRNNNPVRDPDIRFELLSRIETEFEHDPETKIVPELGLCNGSVRIDVAVINGAIHGYEIKSARDTLQRLTAQQDVYSKVCDFVTIIGAGSHLEKIADMVPAWWGITEATLSARQVVLQPRRNPQQNTHIDPFALAQLLWRDEALDVLRGQGIGRGLASKPRKVLWARLANELSIEELGQFVRERIKERTNWRVDQQRKSRGDWSQPFST